MKSKRGFTLIELLVVIAIIGILSAVVLASLNTARTKGSDAGVKANLDTVKTQAALYQNDHNGYGTFALADCPTPGTSGSTMFQASTTESAIAAALADSTSGAVAKCASDDANYMTYVTRPDQNNSTYWCVDSTGISCGVDTAPTGTACGTCLTTK